MARYVEIWQEVAANRIFALNCLQDRSSELIVEISDAEERKVLIVFGSYLSYRRIDEGDALVTLNEMAGSSGTAKTFYRVGNSEFLSWFHVQSQGIYEGRALRHSSICTLDDIIDVISLDVPRVEVGA